MNVKQLLLAWLIPLRVLKAIAAQNPEVTAKTGVDLNKVPESWLSPKVYRLIHGEVDVLL